MITYTFSIVAMRVIEDYQGVLDNVVYEVDWCTIGSDGQFTARYSNCCIVGDPDPENFTPFESLTEETVASWVPDHLSDGVKQTVDDLILAQVIEAQAVYRPLPWQATAIAADGVAELGGMSSDSSGGVE